MITVRTPRLHASSLDPAAPAQVPTIYVTKMVRDLEVQYPSGLVSLTLMPEDIINTIPAGEPPEFCDFSVAIAASSKMMTFYKEGRQWMSLSYRPHRFISTLKDAIADAQTHKEPDKS